MNFWHGGNLDDFNDIISQKNGRYEYGPGLYLITHHDTAIKYSKGSRKLYLITVSNGTDINDGFIDYKAANDFVRNYVIKNLRVPIWNRMDKYFVDGKIKAYIFNSIILNEKGLKPINTKFLRTLYISNGIDYEIVHNPYGWGERMMVLYNMDNIVNAVVVNPKDKIDTYNL